MLRILALLSMAYVGLVVLVYFRQRSMLFFPSHRALPSGLNPWSDGSQVLGYCREMPNPRTIWFMMHGNGGEAADRDYVVASMSEDDSLYVLEYPGYGAREGSPSMESINRAAREAYRILRSQHPNLPICALGESIGSGPACVLAQENAAPDKIVLVVPFDSLVKVGSYHFPFLPVRLVLRDPWNNVEALRQYRGPVEIFGAKNDTIIPIAHARALANQIPGAQFTAIEGDHNDWSLGDQVRIRR
jgi:pimeloyl-ACP methyl ester carboxylesterase